MNSLTNPLLDKPATGWSHDLPGPSETPSIEPEAKWIRYSPNHIDDVYMELARSTVLTRGVAAYLGIMTIILSIISAIMLPTHIFCSRKIYTLIVLLYLTSIPLFLAMGVFMWRLDTTPPIDEPIRFNRSRRKVYVYRFHYAGLHPFSRTAWFIRAEVYNWDDLRAEACSIYGPMGSGGLIETVSLAVVEPGTNKVLDRFHFAHGGFDAEMYWALAQIYMQQGPEALPRFDRPPRDLNNEKFTLNIARYLAPQVKWPEHMDLESRTAVI